ncbi:MAG: 23S rRNA (pseudouridine(1915)-N(3))-methyltransferase RlmH [Bacteroidales bacterium]|jgi:23S rRNA (pseudouridine1915-N3)-methyltransferase|nr:23S rRNA (pseudouridine(1915)-N(3))-methyltransferase RlmH [Bacteroidales bacterium]
MKVKLYLIGKTDKSEIQSLIELFSKRIERYIRFETLIIPDIKNTASLSESQQKTKEGQALLAKIRPNEFLVLLDEKGKTMSSKQFSKFIEKHMVQSTQCLSFIIGGPYGFSKEVYAKASGKMSLSEMTFSHQIIRVIFAEQLYRAFTIIRNEPYHHE